MAKTISEDEQIAKGIEFIRSLTKRGGNLRKYAQAALKAHHKQEFAYGNLIRASNAYSTATNKCNAAWNALARAMEADASARKTFADAVCRRTQRH